MVEINIKKYSSPILGDTMILQLLIHASVNQLYDNTTEDQVILSILF